MLLLPLKIIEHALRLRTYADQGTFFNQWWQRWQKARVVFISPKALCGGREINTMLAARGRGDCCSV